MRRLVLGLLLSAALAAPEPVWAASSRDYAGPCANETKAPGTPQYLVVDVRTRPTDERIINLPAPGRLKMGISCVYTEFKVTRLGDGQVVFQHRCNKHGFGWYDVTNLPAGSYRATAEAKRISFEGFNAVEGHGTNDINAFAGNGGAFQPVNCSPSRVRPGSDPESNPDIGAAHHAVQLLPGEPQPGRRHAPLRPGHRQGVPDHAVGWQPGGLRRAGSAALGVQHGRPTG